MSVTECPGRPAKHLRDRGLLAATTLTVSYAVTVLLVTRSFAALSPDATEYALVARNLVRGGGYAVDMVVLHVGLLPSVHHVPDLHGILQPFLIAPLFAVFGVAAALVKIPSVLFAAGLPLVTFVVARRAFGELAGILAAVLLLAQFDLAVLGVVGSDDVTFSFFSMLALHATERALETGKKAWHALLGASVALATLAKFTGVPLAVVLIGVVALGPSPAGSWARKCRLCVVLSASVLGASVLYALRNHRAHGAPGFSFSAIEWLWKDHFWNYFAYYESAPTLSDVWAQLGAGRMAELVLSEARVLARVVAARPLVYVGGSIALWVVRRERTLATFGALFSLALGFVVCVPHHVEARYLLGLFPVYAAAVAGALVKGTAFLRERVRVVAAARLRGVLFVAIAVAGAAGLVETASRLRALPSPPNPCADAVRFLRDAAAPHARVLTSNPWFVSWEADLGAVNAPTNGDAAMSTVARHYRTEWALTGLPTVLSVDLEGALFRPRVRRALRPKAAFLGAECTVYRLRGL